MYEEALSSMLFSYLLVASILICASVLLLLLVSELYLFFGTDEP